MKSLLLVVLFSAAFIRAEAQTSGVTSLPTGRYETLVKDVQKWEKGDIILLDEQRYRLTSSGETGEYRFSVSAQRIFFMSGPLKGVYARTALASNNAPVILIPLTENEQIGLKQAQGDIAGYHRRQ